MTENFTDILQSRTVDIGDISIHLLHNGAANGDSALDAGSRPAILFLHGFPEYYRAWKQVLPLLANDHLVIAPDQRGYNLSSAPQDVSSYRTALLVGDMVTLMEKLLPGDRFHLVGHDWGASIAYAIAIKRPDRIATLTVINGVHPIPFQRALSTDKKQAQASQYFHILCARDAAMRMSDNGFARTFSMFEKFSSTPWLEENHRQEYLKAWSIPGRMNAMLNWYRASPMIVPVGSALAPPAPLLDVDPVKFNIQMPHQVLWGLQDTALLPVARRGLEEFSKQLKIVEVEDAGHWINHTHPEFIAEEIRQFVSSPPT